MILFCGLEAGIIFFCGEEGTSWEGEDCEKKII